MNRTTTTARPRWRARRRRAARRRVRRRRRRRRRGDTTPTTAAPPRRADDRRDGRRRRRRPVGVPGPARHPDRLVPRGRARRALRDGRRGLHRRHRQARSSPARSSPAAQDTGHRHRDPHRRPGDRRPAGVRAAVRRRRHHLGYANTEGQVLRWAETPVISVVAPLEINPQIIYWDPETYPDVETLADLGEEGVTINVFTGGTFAEVFVAEGIWNEDQVDPSYDGSPARFIAEDGAIAQQGFASAEPYKYENEFEEWGKPIAFQTLHDAGFEVYSQTLSVRPDKLEELTPVPRGVRARRPAGGRSTTSTTPPGRTPSSSTPSPSTTLLDLRRGRRRLLGGRPRRSSASSATAPTTRSATWTRRASRACIDQIRDAGLDVPADLVADRPVHQRVHRREHRAADGATDAPAAAPDHDGGHPHPLRPPRRRARAQPPVEHRGDRRGAGRRRQGDAGRRPRADPAPGRRAVARAST